MDDLPPPVPLSNVLLQYSDMNAENDSRRARSPKTQSQTSVNTEKPVNNTENNNTENNKTETQIVQSKKEEKQEEQNQDPAIEPAENKETEASLAEQLYNALRDTPDKSELLQELLSKGADNSFLDHVSDFTPFFEILYIYNSLE